MKFSQPPGISFVFKTVVFALLCWFIVDRLFFQNDFRAQWHFFLQSIKLQNLFLLLLAIVAMPLNWVLETVKWKILLQSKQSFGKLLKGVIAGITTGFVTPSRTGEFLGRVMYLDESEPVRAFLLSSMGGIAQTVVTLIAGVFFVAIWNSDPLYIGLTTGVGAIFILAFFRFDAINRALAGIPFLKDFNLFIPEEEFPSVLLQFKVLLFSFVRYSIYLLQYVLVFLFFGVSDNFYALVVHTGAFLVALTFSPLLPFLDFSYREGVALYVFNNFSTNTIGILSAVSLVWLLNLVLPAVIGYFFILKRKTLPVEEKFDEITDAIDIDTGGEDYEEEDEDDEK